MSSPNLPRGDFPEGAVGYQVYVRSFADADGDGVGDLAGLLSRLAYLERLGVDAVWLSPIQTSPQVDHGYDVADYTDVDPLFGDLALLDEVVAAVHARGMRILLDLVPNHCSDRHPLFEAALAASPGSPERAMFHFRRGSGPDGTEPPNDWTSVFGGPAWTRVPDPTGGPGEWYLHLYTPQQPDWNWAEPRVAEMFDGILRFWSDRGVDGFRVDVAHGLVKRAGYPGLGQVVETMDGLRSNAHVCDLDEVHDVYRRWRGILDTYSPARYLVGEVNLPPDRSWRYTRPGELDQVFTFPLWRLGWCAEAWAHTLTAVQEVTRCTGAPVAWTLENHDLPRAASRFGGGDRGRRRSLAMTCFLLGLSGATYLYQGQELALPSVEIPEEVRTDPAAPGGVPLGRDGARVPLPWTPHGPSLGFGSSGDPWLPQPGGWTDLSVSEQNRHRDSALSTVRRAVAVRRKAVHELRGGIAEFHCADDVLTARTPAWTVVLPMGSTGVRCDPGDVVFSSIPITAGGEIRPDACAWLTHPPDGYGSQS